MYINNHFYTLPASSHHSTCQATHTHTIFLCPCQQPPYWSPSGGKSAEACHLVHPAYGLRKHATLLNHGKLPVCFFKKQLVEHSCTKNVAISPYQAILIIGRHAPVEVYTVNIFI